MDIDLSTAIPTAEHVDRSGTWKDRLLVVVAGLTFVAACLAFVTTTFQPEPVLVDRTCEPPPENGVGSCTTIQSYELDASPPVQLGLLALAAAAGALGWRRWRRAMLDDRRLATRTFQERRGVFVMRLCILGSAALVPYAVGGIDSESSVRSLGDVTGRTVIEGAPYSSVMMLVAVGIVVGAGGWFLYVVAAEYLARCTSARLGWRDGWREWKRGGGIDHDF